MHTQQHYRLVLDTVVDEIEVIRPEDPARANRICNEVERWIDDAGNPETDPTVGCLLADLRYVQGVLAHNRGDLQSAMERFEDSIALSDQFGCEERRVHAMRSAALCYENAGRQHESSHLILQALERADASGDQRLRALVSLTLCAMYQAQGAWASLLAQAERTSNLAERADDPHLLSRAYSGVGVALGYNGRPSEGMSWIDRAAEALGDRALPLESLFLDLNRMFLMRRAGDVERLVALSHRLPDNLERIPAADVARLFVMLADSVLEAGDIDRALDLLGRAEDTVHDGALTAHLIEYHRVAAKLHERRGDAKRALRSLRSSTELDREIRGRQAQARLVDIERHFERELSKKTAEIHQLRNVELAEKNRELADLNRQKDDILRVVAHDLRNPLAAVHMLGDFLLQDAQGRTDEEAVDQLRSLLTATGEMDRIIDGLLQLRNRDIAEPSTAGERNEVT